MVFLGIVGWLILDVLLLRQVPQLVGGLGLVPRMALTALLVAPLGFLLGMPFPKAGMRVGALRR